MLVVVKDSSTEELNDGASVNGQIESIIGGTVKGWVFNESNPSEETEIQVYCDNRIVGEGMANEFRQDLLNAKIGKGKHAFSIVLDPSICDGNTRSIVLVEKSTGNVIPTNKFSAKIDTLASGEIQTIECGKVFGTFNFRKSVDAADCLVVVKIDGVVFKKIECKQEGSSSKCTFQFSLPSFVFNGMPHYFEASIQGISTEFKPHIEIFNSIQTSWEYINTSSLRNNYSQLSKTSSYRYDSLKNHLRYQQKNKLVADYMANIVTAHDVVVEGFIERNKFPKLSLPKVVNPKVSIIVPVHNKLEITYHCIASNILAFNKTSYELIVVDDCSTDGTSEIEEIIDNLQVVRNTQNLGFLRSCNKAVQESKGEFVLLLNNDTEVTSGWVDEMLLATGTFNKVGAVGSKLIYPDGRLQEAGGIVWNNGKPWNIGNRQNPQDPKFNYARESDYISGAALLVRRSVWEEVDGFSDEFAPAYYEDTDIAFKIREAGYRTMYCPSSVVVHFEGMSNGTDLDTGVKNNQVINAPKFRAKWRNAYRHNGKEGQDLYLQMDRGNSARVLFVDYTVPKPDHDAGSYAVVQEMKLYQELGCKVTFAALNLAHMGKYTDSLQFQGVECVYAPFFTSIQQFLKERGEEFDVVHIVRYDIAEHIIEMVRKFTSAKVAFNNSDLHFLRELRESLSKGDMDLSGPLATREKELRLMQKVDVILSYNELEHAVIMSHNLKADNIFKCPWVLEEKKANIDFDVREGIAFLGGFNHLPNRESVHYFVNKVMPVIRKQSTGIKFHVYGSNVPQEIKDLACEDVIIEGFVEHLDSVFHNCRVFVAPLLSGAGIKGKVLESVAYGMPSVLSPIAAEATGLVDRHSTLIAENPDDWAKHVLSLYNDKETWERYSENASLLTKREYSIENGLSKFGKMLDYLEVFPASRAEKLFT